mmetsp:Transcript_22157/g.36640  ORF Transcript_22157/g.36640 Transcript_22157/m.36640 type:complete len:464 (-) Transcript_22157:495-1886(-)|eukprot:CAMPEP_0119298220 /NCGR_PEP_ID=MMETSP1333-20130426/414_1 /TAXON_ID=418940 /ORGANISM="Scyphosphaera apsteinii, Strain RCC1455" /LENGTH=463 /DNA_ID=CAMNT_0007299263 /DNA_START=46 /DNA_END=1437 /DNA_ORIENTATION=+
MPALPSSAVLKKSLFANEDVLIQDVPWKSLWSAGMCKYISEEELDMIYTIDNQPIEKQLAMIDAKGTAYISTLCKALGSGIKEEYVQYLLAMLDVLLAANADVAMYFHATLHDSKGTNDPIAPLMNMLSRQSAFILEKSTLIISKVLSYTHFIPVNPDGVAEECLARHLATFSEWLIVILKAVDPTEGLESSKADYALSSLQRLVSSSPGRANVVAEGGILVLIGLMRVTAVTNSAVQLLYQVVFCLWSLSYSTEAALAMVTTKLGLVAKLVDIVKSVQKEKVVRVALATLKNLLGTASASADMVGAGLVKVLDHLQHRKWADEDIMVDIEALSAALQANLQTMSSWDVYAKEVASGRLEWSPSHKSDNFWKDNYRNFDLHDHAMMKQLVALLSSDDPTTLAIACHDISELVKIHPEGRRLLTQFAAKPPAMQLLKHSDPEVQKYALTAVQRLMVIHWESLHK